MKNQNTPYTVQRPQRTNLPDSKFLRNIDIPLLYYVIKVSCSEEHPLSINQLTDIMNHLFQTGVGEELFDARTLRRKIELLLGLQSSSTRGKQIESLLEIAMGGKIEYTEAEGIISGRNRNGKGTQKRFYFKPVLSDSDITLICGAIQSNRYLSTAEKDYLLSRIRLLNPVADTPMSCSTAANAVNMLPAFPKVKRNAVLPMDASCLLRNISVLYRGIKEEKKVRIQYGTYDIASNSKIHFHTKSEAFVVNPYAMFWNNGQYYLVATSSISEHPYHYRVDRIISAAVETQTDKNGLKAEVERDKIPENLKGFYKLVGGKKKEFDDDAYTAAYPNMRIYEEESFVDCTFECTAWSLQILVDAFGADKITLRSSPVAHTAEEVDVYGRPQKFLAATIKHIQYDNAQKFCLAHPEYLTLLSPLELVEEVADNLSKFAERYKKYAEFKKGHN